MLALLILPALLGVALVVNLLDDDDTAQESDTRPNEIDVPNDVDNFDANGEDQIINARDAGGSIDALSGDDTVNGSDNIDMIRGGSGNDVIYARGGDDVVSGGPGDDRIFLGDGNDDATSDGADLGSTGGDDLIRGGSGNDLIVDSLGSNTVFGDLGSDSISVVDGLSDDGITGPPSDYGSADNASGGFGNDQLLGDDGDTLTGGADSDLFGILVDTNRDQEVVTITDFNTEEDTLAVLTFGPDPDDNIVTFDFDETSQQVRAFIETRQVAVLNGLTAADIPNIRSELILA